MSGASEAAGVRTAILRMRSVGTGSSVCTAAIGRWSA